MEPGTCGDQITTCRKSEVSFPLLSPSPWDQIGFIRTSSKYLPTEPPSQSRMISGLVCHRASAKHGVHVCQHEVMEAVWLDAGHSISIRLLGRAGCISVWTLSGTLRQGNKQDTHAPRSSIPYASFTELIHSLCLQPGLRFHRWPQLPPWMCGVFLTRSKWSF